MIFIFFTNCSFEQFIINRNYYCKKKRKKKQNNCLCACVCYILLFFLPFPPNRPTISKKLVYKSKLHTLYRNTRRTMWNYYNNHFRHLISYQTSKIFMEKISYFMCPMVNTLHWSWVLSIIINKLKKTFWIHHMFHEMKWNRIH